MFFLKITIFHKNFNYKFKNINYKLQLNNIEILIMTIKKIVKITSLYFKYNYECNIKNI